MVQRRGHDGSQARRAIELRWMVRRDFDDVLAIERASFDRPWESHDLEAALKRRNCVGKVLVNERQVIAGYVIWSMHDHHLQIETLAVAPHSRRNGNGRLLVEHLKQRLSPSRNRLVAHVGESSLTAQQFLRGCGMRCVSVVDGFFSSPQLAAAYRFEFHFDGCEVTP